MNTDDYFEHVQKQLRGLDPAEQADVLDEIASHLEAGEQDPAFGPDPESRRSKAIDEIGPPGDLGRHLRDVHRPGHWIDFLLVAVPSFLFRVFPFLGILLNLTLPVYAQWGDGRQIAAEILAALLIDGILILAGLLRRSLLVLVFWLGTAIFGLVSLLANIHRADLGSLGSELAVVGLCVLCLAALLAWLMHLLWQQRHDLLLVAFAFLPFLTAFENSSAVFIGLRWPALAGLSTLASSLLPVSNLLALIGLGLVFLHSSRTFRWWGLLIYAMCLSLPAALAIWAQSSLAAGILLWAAQAGVVLLAWLLERRMSQAEVAVV